MRINLTLKQAEIDRVVESRPDLRTLDRTAIVRFALDQLVLGANTENLLLENSRKLDLILATLATGNQPHPDLSHMLTPIYKETATKTPVTDHPKPITTPTKNQDEELQDDELEYDDPTSSF